MVKNCRKNQIRHNPEIFRASVFSPTTAARERIGWGGRKSVPRVNLRCVRKVLGNAAGGLILAVKSFSFLPLT